MDSWPEDEGTWGQRPQEKGHAVASREYFPQYPYDANFSHGLQLSCAVDVARAKERANASRPKCGDRKFANHDLLCLDHMSSAL